MKQRIALNYPRKSVSSSKHFTAVISDVYDVLSSVAPNAGCCQYGVPNAYSHTGLEDDLTVLWVVTWVGVLLSLKSNAVDVSGNDIFAELGLFDGLSHKLRDLLDFPARLYRIYDPLLRLIIGISKLDELHAYELRSHATCRFAAYEGAGHITGIEIHDRVQIYNDRIPVSYTHLRAHETDSYLVCRLL